MNTKTVLTLIGLIILALVLSRMVDMHDRQIDGQRQVQNTQDTAKEDETPIESNEVKFSGTISAYSTNCFADGICSVTIDDKIVITTIGWRQGPVGTLEGVESIGDLEQKIGHKASVYAAQTPEGDYTLYGKNSYYIKVE